MALILYPGKNCVSCHKSIAKQTKSNDAHVELELIDSDSDYINDNPDVNSWLESIGISPISNDAKAKSTRIFKKEKENCHKLMMYFDSVY